MNASSDTRPNEVDVERHGQRALVYMRRNITEEKAGEGSDQRTYYSYDERSVGTDWYTALEESVTRRFDDWWERAGIQQAPESPMRKRMDAAEAGIGEVSEQQNVARSDIDFCLALLGAD